ncbi:hypothetical protein SDJN02_08018 [Cucurbita argyrosperma subsp. argyrosperma]|nr:hypothetical protein SDJN02_08018 [Cucurbita argyrosperma subsp. argyrosperma]
MKRIRKCLLIAFTSGLEVSRSSSGMEVKDEDKNGPTETNAGLEFAMNTLKVGYFPFFLLSNLIFIISRLNILLITECIYLMNS